METSEIESDSPTRPLDDLQSADLEAINVPVLIVTNQDNTYLLTKPEDSKAIKMLLTGP